MFFWMHTSYAPYSIHVEFVFCTDDLFKMMKDSGSSLYHPEVGQNYDDANTFFLDFRESSSGRNLQGHVSAIDLEHLENCKS